MIGKQIVALIRSTLFLPNLWRWNQRVKKLQLHIPQKKYISIAQSISLAQIAHRITFLDFLLWIFFLSFTQAFNAPILPPVYAWTSNYIKVPICISLLIPKYLISIWKVFLLLLHLQYWYLVSSLSSLPSGCLDFFVISFGFLPDFCWIFFWFFLDFFWKWLDFFCFFSTDLLSQASPPCPLVVVGQRKRQALPHPCTVAIYDPGFSKLLALRCGLSLPCCRYQQSGQNATAWAARRGRWRKLLLFLPPCQWQGGAWVGDGLVGPAPPSEGRGC